MTAIIEIDGEYNTEISSGDRIITYSNDAKLSFTLSIGGFRSIRKTLSYSFSGDPERIVDEILNRKNYYPKMDLFGECPYCREDITDIKVVWDRSNMFLTALFDVVKMGNLIANF